MINLNRLECFVAIVDSGSFTRAADMLGLTKAMVSVQLKKLESELGIALITRTTRRLALTEVGEQFYQDCVRVVREAEAAVDSARSGHAALTGALRLTSTAEYGAHFLIPALAAFGQQHEQLRIEFCAASAQSDLASERFDVAIRLGQIGDSAHRATRIGSFRVLAVASPAYLSRQTRPRSAEELESLDWVVHAGFQGALVWSEVAAPSRQHSVTLGGRHQADNADAVLSFALAHCGAALLPDWLIQNELARGELVEILPGYSLPEQGIYAVFPNTHHVPAKVRQFIDFLRVSVTPPGVLPH